MRRRKSSVPARKPRAARRVASGGVERVEETEQPERPLIAAPDADAVEAACAPTTRTVIVAHAAAPSSSSLDAESSSELASSSSDAESSSEDASSCDEESPK